MGLLYDLKFTKFIIVFTAAAEITAIALYVKMNHAIRSGPR